MGLEPDEAVVDEYFEYLADRDVYRAPTVISWLTDYIDTHSEQSVHMLLQHSLASEAIAGLVDLLEFDDKRLTESVVHILGTIVEHPRCRQYVLQVPRNTATAGQNNPTLFTALVNMLMSDDKNLVMNAAGTIANVAESADGRLWILQQAAFDDALPILGLLTVDSHQWAASNSALVIARLTMSPEGIVKLLTHDRSTYILANLCRSLCGQNPGSSMNSAFAIGRLLEREDARGKLLAMNNFKSTMTALTKMLYNKEAGPRKNSCFAFSSLANSKEGHTRLLDNVNSELILDQLVRLLTDTDDETAWFAAVTLRSICSHKEGVFRLRDHKTVFSVLRKLTKGKPTALQPELLTEVKLTLDIIAKLPKLSPPMVTSVESNKVTVRWESVIATVGTKIIYQLYQGSTCVYEGRSTSATISNLKAFTSYVFRVRATTGVDEGPYSGPVIATTKEGSPDAPADVSNEGKPQHNSIKISWQAPANPNGVVTAYHIYCNDKRVGVVSPDKLTHVVRDLPHSTAIPIQVAAVTAAGEGELSAPIICSTLKLSDFPPKKPILSTSGGANEINVSWIDPPKQLGPIKHYQLVMDGKVIYTGKDQGYRISNLEPLQDYTFNIRVVTANGYVIESEPAKKRSGSRVVKKGTSSPVDSDDGDELAGVSKHRTPTPEIAKLVSEDREIIRPKKKSDRFTVKKGSSNNKGVSQTSSKPSKGVSKSTDKTTSLSNDCTAEYGISSENENLATSGEKEHNVCKTSTSNPPVSKSSCSANLPLDTIAEVSSTSHVSVGLHSPPGSATCSSTDPAAISEVIIKRHFEVDAGETSCSSMEGTLSAPDLSGHMSTQEDLEHVVEEDPRTLAMKSLLNKKSVSFNEQVTVNATQMEPLTSEKSNDDVQCVYVPRVMKARVNAYDPQELANVSATDISIENENQQESIHFLVNYVTSYETSSVAGEDIPPATLNTTTSRVNCDVKSVIRDENSISHHRNLPKAAPQNLAPANTPDTDIQGETGDIVFPVDQNITCPAAKSATYTDKTYENALADIARSVNSQESTDSQHIAQDISTTNPTDGVSTRDNHTDRQPYQRYSNNLKFHEEYHDEDDVIPVSSLTDILLSERGSNCGSTNEMTAENVGRFNKDKAASESDRFSKRTGYRQPDKFNIDDVRATDKAIDQQNKLINAMIAQQNSELIQENKRTRDLIDTVRSNIRNTIKSKRDDGVFRQHRKPYNTSNFIHAVQASRPNVKLASVNMDIFGSDLQHKPKPRVSVLQVSNKINQKRKKKKEKLPPLNQNTVIKDIQFNFPKL